MLAGFPNHQEILFEGFHPLQRLALHGAQAHLQLRICLLRCLKQSLKRRLESSTTLDFHKKRVSSAWRMTPLSFCGFLKGCYEVLFITRRDLITDFFWFPNRRGCPVKYNIVGWKIQRFFPGKYHHSGFSIQLYWGGAWLVSPSTGVVGPFQMAWMAYKRGLLTTY